MAKQETQLQDHRAYSFGNIMIQTGFSANGKHEIKILVISNEGTLMVKPESASSVRISEFKRK